MATPRTWPLSSNDTSAVGGSTESTRLTSLLPLLSLIISPSMTSPLLSHYVELTSLGWQIVLPALLSQKRRNTIPTMKSLLRFLAVIPLAPCLVRPASAQATAHTLPTQPPEQGARGMTARKRRRLFMV